MRAVFLLFSGFIFMSYVSTIFCWTTEDLELFDLVESTSQNFYDVLGVDKRASASDIRKAYRRLSTLYHPDRNKNSDAEETFRKIAAIADVLRNDERRKTYDLVLATGLPDWRMPIYYYRRVRNMGLLDLAIFLFLLATVAQYLFAWSVYWEKKYEIDEIVLSRLKKRAKHQKKGKSAKLDDDVVSEEIINLPKPRCQDLFPVQLFYLCIHLIKSLPSYIVRCKEFFQTRVSEPVEEEEDEEFEQQEARIKVKKHVKPQIPDYTNIINSDSFEPSSVQKSIPDEKKPKKKKLCLENLTESDILEFKKALKKFPNGTLQRWEKVSDCLNCSVSEVVSMTKQLKNQQFSKTMSLSLQGVTGTEKENFGYELYEEKGGKSLEVTQRSLNVIDENEYISDAFKSKDQDYSLTNGAQLINEKFWKQDEQRSLEIALQKYPKDTVARWDRIAEYVQTKSKEECVERYKILVQQIRKKKDKKS